MEINSPTVVLKSLEVSLSLPHAIHVGKTSCLVSEMLYYGGKKMHPLGF